MPTTKRHIDAACAIAYLAFDGEIPEAGVTVRDDLICVRRGQRLTILYEPWVWAKQSLNCFGPVALTAAIYEGNIGPTLARATVVIDFACTPGARHRLVSFNIPGRLAHRFGPRCVRANLDTREVTPMASVYGSKRERPGRALKFASEAVA